MLPVIGWLVALVGKELAFTLKALNPVVEFLAELLAAVLNPVIDLAEGGFRLLSGAVKAAWSVLGPFVKLIGGALVAAFRKLSESGIVAKVFDKLFGALRRLKPPLFGAVATSGRCAATEFAPLCLGIVSYGVVVR
ncbi:hypothetical protein [Streptomyces sp. NPDC004728]|uniref:hypothetical protein n=1 Tax=Streptomyces sp. NPDC004728 TaxID=3154289 RepID=UPI0033B65776